MGMVGRLVIVTVTVVLALTATLVVIALFPPVIVALLIAAGVAFAWWGIGGLRRGRRRLLSVMAVCLAPALFLAAIAAVVAFSPIQHSPDGHSHGAPITVQTSPSP
jgi:membrane associated rhomboid family serine protease